MLAMVDLAENACWEAPKVLRMLFAVVDFP